RRLAPDGHVVDAQLAFAVDLRLLHVHVGAESTAVDQRGADVDQVEQALLQPALLDRLAQLEEFAGQLRRLLRGTQSLAHGMSSVCSDDVREWPDRTKKAYACRSGPGSFVARSDTLRRSHEIPDVHPPF